MTASELAQKWRAEQMEFNDALVSHLVDNLGLKPDEALVIGIGMAISMANMGFSSFVLDLPGYDQMTAEEIVERLGLRPFLESREDDERSS